MKKYKNMMDKIKEIVFTVIFFPLLILLDMMGMGVFDDD